MQNIRLSKMLRMKTIRYLLSVMLRIKNYETNTLI
jgi:hypothetical protein